VARRQPTRRSARKWWWIAGAAGGAIYVVALVGATTVALMVAPTLRDAVASRGFQAALRAARHPITEADLPRLLPGIPIYPGARLDPLLRNKALATIREGQARVNLIAPASAAEIRTYYRTHMTGWEFQGDESENNLLFFRRGDESCWISIMPDLPLWLGRSGGR